MNRVLVLSIVMLMMLIASIAWSAIIHVPADQPTIQAGIDAAVDGDTVLVADGTYTGLGNKNLDFTGKAITVASENGAENCIIDCEGDGRGFYFHSGEGENSVVEGLTIYNGFADDGGGMYNYHSSPTDCTCSSNSTNWWCGGGGMGNDYSSPAVTNCTFTNNRADFWGYGGGMYNDHSSPTVSDCEFSSNLADGGGGMLNSSFSSPTVTNCTFSGNSAHYGGGGMGNLSSSPTVTNCTFSQNSAYNGGGGMGNDSSSPTVTNCTFSLNSANDGDGGGMGNDSSSPTVTNCTFSQNSAEDGGGMGNGASSPTVTNCILWGDSAGEIYNDKSKTTVTYCDVQGGYEGEGNIDADPKFVDPENGDYHLSDYSPCIGAGIMAPSVPDTDIDGNPRPNPPGSNPDMGAYEHPLAEPPLGSINGIVTDITGKPIPQTIVIAINDETKGKYPAPVTDANGYYEILNLAPGTYWVLCIKNGYKADVASVEVEPGAVTPCNFVLQPKLE